jgi:hypothetical protein
MDTHELKQPIEYKIEYMDTVVKTEIRVPGKIGHVISNGRDKRFVDPADDYNLSRLLGYGYQILGRGVLVERVWGDECFIAWRPYGITPEVVPWEE